MKIEMIETVTTVIRSISMGPVTIVVRIVTVIVITLTITIIMIKRPGFRSSAT